MTTRMSLLLLVLCSLGCTPPNPGTSANDAQRKAGIAASDSPTPAAAELDHVAPRHSEAPAFAALTVTFSSPLMTSDKIRVEPGAEVPLSISICNNGSKELDPVLVQLHTGSFASLAENDYSSLNALPAALVAANDDCAAHRQELDFILRATDNVQPGTAVSVSPVLVVQYGREVETYECPFKIEVRSKMPVPPTGDPE